MHSPPGLDAAVLWASLCSVRPPHGGRVNIVVTVGRGARKPSRAAHTAQKPTPTRRRVRRAARPPEHLRDDDGFSPSHCFSFSIFLSRSFSPNRTLAHSSLYNLSPFFTAPSGMCAVTAAAELVCSCLCIILYIIIMCIHCIFRSSAQHAFVVKQVASRGATQKQRTVDVHINSVRTAISRRDRERTHIICGSGKTLSSFSFIWPGQLCREKNSDKFIGPYGRANRFRL